MSNTKLHVPGWLDAHIPDIALAFNITGIVLTALLLLAIAYVAWNPISRIHLNRVSFRLLVCALISNLIFGATSIPTFSGPSAGCSFMAFFGLSILMFSACMFFCTVLNLQLVLVHHVNGNSMEKFYYIGSVAVVAILNITPYAAGQFGYYYGTCWFSDPRPDVQFRWLLGSQSVWILLMSTGEVVSFFVILGSMYRLRNPRGMSSGPTFGVIPKPPIVVYRGIILRIGLYPLLSCCLNFTGCIVDIWLTKNPDPTELQFRLSFLDLCVFALRPTLYTLLAATDPGFLSALRALRSPSNSKTITTTTGMMMPLTHSTGPTSNATYIAQDETNSTMWRAVGNKSSVEQSSATSKPFEEQSVASHGDAGRTREQSGLKGEEDIVRQI